MSVEITLGEPVIVAQAREAGLGWGPFQFPFIQRLPDGRLEIGYHIEEDRALAYGRPPGVAVSMDEGASWTDAKDAEILPPWLERLVYLPNGDLLRQSPRAGLKLEEVRHRLPRPLTTGKNYGKKYSLYLSRDVPEEFTQRVFYRMAKNTREWREEKASVDIPGELRVSTDGVLVVDWFHRIKIAPDGALWGLIYTRRLVGGQVQKYFAAVFVVSRDNGKSWKYLSEIPYQGDRAADKLADKRFGFTEPNITFMPDGSIFCLLRTTDGIGPGPMYWTRSTDDGLTWSIPLFFDTIGVLPALLTLGNGVTLATYGRPGFYLRGTGDPAGRTWDSRVVVVEPGDLSRDTCSYSDLLALDDNTALVTYSKFDCPNADGEPRKTILVRRVETHQTRLREA